MTNTEFMITLARNLSSTLLASTLMVILIRVIYTSKDLFSFDYSYFLFNLKENYFEEHGLIYFCFYYFWVDALVVPLVGFIDPREIIRKYKLSDYQNQHYDCILTQGECNK